MWRKSNSGEYPAMPGRLAIWFASADLDAFRTQHEAETGILPSESEVTATPHKGGMNYAGPPLAWEGAPATYNKLYPADSPV